MLFLLFERLKGKESSWKPYLDFLPEKPLTLQKLDHNTRVEVNAPLSTATLFGELQA